MVESFLPLLMFHTHFVCPMQGNFELFQQGPTNLYGITRIRLSSKRYLMMPYISYFILSAPDLQKGGI
jgi:hypothetical protein